MSVSAGAATAPAGARRDWPEVQKRQYSSRSEDTLRRSLTGLRRAVLPPPAELRYIAVQSAPERRAETPPSAEQSTELESGPPTARRLPCRSPTLNTTESRNRTDSPAPTGPSGESRTARNSHL